MNKKPGPFIYAPPLEPYLTVIQRDEDLLVLSKPSGLLSVPGRLAEHADCLETRARESFAEARIVHRLDKDTSGVIVMAMNAKAHRHLGLQFERRHVAKTYIAKVWGEMAEDHGEVDLPLRCDWPNRPLQMVDHELGKPAKTGWQVLERKSGVTRVKLTPHTGRSHQLRVHMCELGHPILGDVFYAHEEARAASRRLCLHAQSLGLHHPTGGEWMEFEDACGF